MIFQSFPRNFAMLVAAWSIRSELAMNEKQGPTTKEMTAKISELEYWMNFRFEAYAHRWFWHYDLPHIYTQFCHVCHSLIHTKRTSHEREAGTHYKGNYSQISELESWMNFWFEAYAHRWFFHYDLRLSSTQFCHACHRLIHTERPSHEREAGTHYKGNYSQISELESWMNSWFEAYAHRWFCHYDLPLISTQFCHACHRLIHTERTSHEREAGFLMLMSLCDCCCSSSSASSTSSLASTTASTTPSALSCHCRHHNNKLMKELQSGLMNLRLSQPGLMNLRLMCFL